MTLEQLTTVKPADEAIMTVRRVLLDGTVEPALDIYPAAPGSMPSSESGELFVAVDPDPFYGHRQVGVIELDAAEDEEPVHLKVVDEGTLSEEPEILLNAVEGLMKVRAIDKLAIRISDTNLPERALRRIGHVGLSPNAFEIQLHGT